MINKLLIAILLFSFANLSFALPKITEFYLTKAPTYTRMAFRFSDYHSVRVFTLANPDRLVMDIPLGSLSANARREISQTVALDAGIKSIRTGHPEDNMLRLVFDTTGPIQYQKNEFPGQGAHEKLVFVDFYTLQPMAAVAEVKPVHIRPSAKIVQTTPVFLPKPAIDKIVKMINEPIKEIKEIKEQRVVAKVQQPQFQPESSLPVKTPVIPVRRTTVIVIDAGHGGKDQGTIGPRGTKEKDLVLAVALRLADLINSQPNMQAILTRQADYFVKLRDRLGVARNHKADMFIALHADSYSSNKFSGATVYALSTHGATNEAARWLTKVDANSELGKLDLSELSDKSYEVRSVLIDLAQTATIKNSLRLGTDVLSSLGKMTKLHYYRVEQAPFVVLKSPDIPSVLIELGFLTNKDDEERLRSIHYRDKLAVAILKGIRSYLGNHSSGI